MLRQIELYPRQRPTKYWYSLFLVKVTKMIMYIATLYCWLSGYHLSSNSVMLTCMFIQFSEFFLLLFTGSRGKKGDDGAKAVSGWYTLTLSHPELMSIYLSLLCSRPFREHKMVKRPLEAPRTFSWRNWSKVWEARSTPQITLIQGVL